MRSIIILALVFITLLSNAKIIDDEHVDTERKLVGSAGTTRRSSSSAEDAWGGFVFGIGLIPFSLALIWKNEKKIVRYHQVIKAAKKELKENQSCEEINEKNEKALVHMIGQTHTVQDTCDERMSYSRPNCYKIERVVEMYQHVQHKHTSGGKNKSVTYSYNDEWCWNQEKDEHFVRESEKGRNPVIEWPFKSEDIQAKEIMLGAYHLSSKQTNKLKGQQVREDWENDEEGRLEQVLTNLNESCKGFRPFERHGEYLYSSTTEAEPLGTDHIGSFRVRFEYSLCGEVSLMAQQIYNPTDSVWTFRKWNPLKKGLPYGEDTSEKDAKNCMCLRSFFCLCCVIVGWCMDSMAEEVVFMIEEEKTCGQEYLKKQDVEVRTMGCGLRPTGILLSVFGWFLLFLPSIEFFKWIPLIGHMMSWTFFVIALVVGLLVGGSLAVLVLAVAWLRFNPLWGILLLSLTGIGVACIFILPTYF